MELRHTYLENTAKHYFQLQQSKSLEAFITRKMEQDFSKINF